MKKVEAFKCDYCHRCFGRAVDAINHERACQRNPARRACKTCEWSAFKVIAVSDCGDGRTCEHEELWCNHPKVNKPMSDKPYYQDCDFNELYRNLVPVPGTCEHYFYHEQCMSANHTDGGEKMTYKESYMKCDTLSELEEAINNDVAIALLVNPHRLKVIKLAGEEVANLKFGEETENE